MTTIITSILEAGTWEIIFSSAFFFGLLFFIIVMLGALGDDEAEIDDGDMDADGFDVEGDALDLDGDGIPDGIDLDGDGTLDIEFDGDFDTDVDFDAEVDTDFDSDFDMDSDLDADGDMDLDADIDDDFEFDEDTFDSVELGSTPDVEASDDVQVYKSQYKMGNISAFLFIFGQIGWIYSDTLQDHHLLIAVLGGFIAAKTFGYVIANYTKTVVVPIQNIRRGDIAKVRYTVTPNKAGIIQVARRDGVISTEMAKGAYPHDYFNAGEKGYIWAKEGGFYLITKGIQGQPDLDEQKPTKALDKKAMD